MRSSKEEDALCIVLDAVVLCFSMGNNKRLFDYDATQRVCYEHNGSRSFSFIPSTSYKTAEEACCMVKYLRSGISKGRSRIVVETRHRLMVVKVYTMIELNMRFHDTRVGEFGYIGHGDLEPGEYEQSLQKEPPNDPPKKRLPLGPIRKRIPYCSGHPTLFGDFTGKPASLHILIAGSRHQTNGASLLYTFTVICLMIDVKQDCF